MTIKVRSFFNKSLGPFYLVLIVGIFLRLQAFLTKSFAFTYDVGRDMIAVSEIATLKHISLIGPTTGLPGVFYGPWWYLMLTPFFIVSGGDPAAIDFALALAGIVTIILSFVVGSKISGKYTGFAYATIVAFSPFLIFTSSQIWNPNIAPLFTVLVALCMIAIFSKKEALRNFFFLGLLLGLIFDIEIVYGLFLFAGVCITVVLERKLKIKIKEIGLFFLGLFILFSPRILFEFRNGFIMTTSFINFVIHGEKETGNITLLNKFSFVVDQASQAFSGNNFIFGLVVIVITLITLLIFYKKAQKEEKQFIRVSLFIITTFLLGILVFNHNLYPHYFAGLTIFFILPVAIALSLISKNVNKYFSYLLLGVIILINFNPISFISSLQKPLFVGNAAVYRNQLAVVDYVYREAHGKDFKYVVYTPPVFDYSYRYLFDWYGFKKYGYRARQQPNLAFFILEPDYESPQRLTDWLKTRRNDGKIVKSTKLPSGIVIQTRINK